MANLTRYNVRRDYQDYYNDCKMVDVCSTGEFVKFEDVAKDEICSNDVCEYCAKYGKCFGTQHFPTCFVGRKCIKCF